MKTLTCFLLVGLAGQAALAQHRPAVCFPPTGRTPTEFIPTGYHLLPNGLATGDLNQDSHADAVLVFGLQVEDQNEQRPARVLVVLLASATGGYTVSTSSTHAVLGKGGMARETFQKVAIEKGVVLLEHYSASNWFWHVRSQFRQQAGTFYLIGETTESGRTGGNCAGLRGPAGWQYRDTNFVTGLVETWRISEGCRVLEHRQNRSKLTALLSLTDYQPPEL